MNLFNSSMDLFNSSVNITLEPYLTFYDENRTGAIIYLTVLITMTVVGTLGNCLIIFSSIKVRSLRKPGNLFIVNLALSDLLVTTINNPFAIVGTIYGRPWFMGDRWPLCMAIGTICLVGCATGLLSILFIAFNRFVALLNHQHYSRIFTWRNCIIMCVLLWCTACLLVSPLHYGWGGHRFDEKALMCLFHRSRHYSFNTVLVCVIILGPVILIFYFYLRIFLYVRHNKRSLRRVMGKEQRKKRGGEVKEETKLARSLFVVFMGFFVCWIPFAVVCLFDFEDAWPRWVYVFTLTIDHLTASGLNFLLYGLTNKNFRDGYRAVWLMITCRGEPASSSRTWDSASSIRKGAKVVATAASSVGSAAEI